MSDHPIPLAIAMDVDETLISTGGAGARSWRRAFEALWGVEADIGKFTSGGMTDPEVGRITFRGVMGREPASRELTRLMHAYLGFLPQEVAESPGYRVLPGVEALLPRLIEAGVLVGITTGAVEAAAHIKLARAGLNQYFCFGGFGSDSKDRSELTRVAIGRASTVLGAPLDPARVCVVGDTPLDIEAAHAAGVAGIGVATGKYTADELERAGADHVLNSLADPFPGLAAHLGPLSRTPGPGDAPTAVERTRRAASHLRDRP